MEGCTHNPSRAMPQDDPFLTPKNIKPWRRTATALASVVASAAAASALTRSTSSSFRLWGFVLLGERESATKFDTIVGKFRCYRNRRTWTPMIQNMKWSLHAAFLRRILSHTVLKRRCLIRFEKKKSAQRGTAHILGFERVRSRWATSKMIVYLLPTTSSTSSFRSYRMFPRPKLMVLCRIVRFNTKYPTTETWSWN